jgi:hypothetical protein
MAYWWLRNANYAGDVKIANSTHLNFGLDDFTICGVIKKVGTGTDYPCQLLMGDGLTDGFSLQFDKIDEVYRLKFWMGWDTPALNAFIVSDASFDNGQTHFITVTCDRDSNTGLNLYIDGVIAAIPVDPTPLSTKDFVFDIDAIVGPTAYLSYIDQIRFYKGIILTPAQILAICNNGVGAKVVEADIEALSPETAFYVEFDEGTGNPVGRYYNGTSWSDSPMMFEGDTEWEEGGVPFSRIITASAGEGGSIEPAGSIEVALDEDQTFIATPASGYQANQWLLDGEVVHISGNSHTLTNISADHTLSVTFSAMSRHLCTLADVKTRLGLSTTDNDEIINSILDGNNGIFDSYTGRRLLLTDETVTEYFGADPGWRRLLFQRYPIVSITSIKEASDYDFDAAGALVANTDYRLVNQGLNGIILRINAHWLAGEDVIEVIYRGGYCGASETPGEGEYALPQELREAAILQAAFMFKRKDDIGLSAVSSQGGSINKFADVELLPLVKQTLDNYKRPSL